MAREQFQTLTEPMYYILLALTEECCGVDIMEQVRIISNERVKVGPGTLYAMLSKFEENGVIQKTAEDGIHHHRTRQTDAEGRTQPAENNGERRRRQAELLDEQ